jgi:hypothetical protein
VTTPLSLSAPILSRSSAPQMKVKTLSAKDQLIELALAQKLPMVRRLPRDY